MAELEIHHEVEGADPFGKKIGVLASILAVLLGMQTGGTSIMTAILQQLFPKKHR